MTYYISENGSDSNNGSLESPWFSLSFAVSSISPGDKIIIRQGTYSIPSTINLTIPVEIVGEGCILLKTTNGSMFNIDGKDVTIRNCTLRIENSDPNSFLLNFGPNCLNVRIQGNSIFYCKYGIAVQGSYISIRENQFARSIGNERLTCLILYNFSYCSIVRNTCIDSINLRRFIYLTGNLNNPFGGFLEIRGNTVDTTSITSSRPQFFIQDKFNLDKQFDILIVDNQLLCSDNGSDFFIPYLTSGSNLNSYGTVQLLRNRVSASLVGIIKCDAALSLTIDSNIIEKKYLFYVIDNIIENFQLRPDYTGDEIFSSSANISPLNLSSLKRVKFVTDLPAKIVYPINKGIKYVSSNKINNIYLPS